jgi:methylenetetrahydrofolate reductase (NADPH)
MEKNTRKQSILVVSHNAELARITRQSADIGVEVDYAPDETQGLNQIRNKRPDIVIIGNLEPAGAVLKFYRELREGWISRHTSLLVVELNTSEDRHRILSEENLVVGIGEYTFLSGATSPLLPSEYLLPRLKEIIRDKLEKRNNVLKASILDPGCFCLTWEQIPGLGAFEVRQETVLENARKAAGSGKICAISIVDNPGGNPAIATEILCSEIRKTGIEPMVHLAFRDKNRNQVESQLYQLAALDINNLLVLTGDYPSNQGFKGCSKPVFDLDSVNSLQLIAEMNRGMEHEIMRKQTRLAPTDFFVGVAVSPFKQEEAEVMGQYYKLKKKIEAGADFAITQIGYDARKLHELQLWLKKKDYNLPVLTSIQVLTYTAARAMNQNRVPGCVVTDKLLAMIAAESKEADKGRLSRLERAAKMYAISRGMGFKGACISGQGLSCENVEYIIDRGQELLPRWDELLPEFNFPQENGFYYFAADPENGLNLEALSPRIQKPAAPPVYYLSRLIHVTLFEPRSPLFNILRSLMRFIDSRKTLTKIFHSLEYWTKASLYSCKDCGDCALFDVAYLCPVSQCPKDQRNAPCGGSYQGWCEVYPNEKKCIWVRAYRRLKADHKEDAIGDNIVPPCDWELWQTSSWINYFSGRDHVSRRTGIKPVDHHFQNKGANKR